MIFSPSDQKTIENVIRHRRDIRHFKPNQTIPSNQLDKIISCGIQAPSVGYMQPWRIIRITSKTLKSKIRSLVEEERQKTAEAIESSQGRGTEFLRLKVEGIENCAELLVIAMVPNRDHFIFGKRTIRELDYASIGACIQNMWLAARTFNIGMGWVSLFDPEKLKKILKFPAQSQPVGIFCLGPVSEFYQEPMLKTLEWDDQKRVSDILRENKWDFKS